MGAMPINPRMGRERPPSATEGYMHFAFALCLAITLLAPIVSEGADQKERAWIATAEIIRNGEQSGSGVYLNSRLIITLLI
jgi:hypothetical protein